MLTGGYSANCCFYTFLNNGFAISNDARVVDSAGNADPAGNDAPTGHTDPAEDGHLAGNVDQAEDDDPGVKSANYVDFNSLYPSADCVCEPQLFKFSPRVST